MASREDGDARDGDAPEEGELRQLGLRATPPRLKILQRLRDGPHRHWTAEALYRDLAEHGDDVGLATVYRVLAQMAQAGVLRRSVFDGQKAVFELDDGPHHDHLVCVRCGRVEEFVDDVIERHQHAVARVRGFELVEHRLALFGVCGPCRAEGTGGGAGDGAGVEAGQPPGRVDG